jgi:hypothetical protein
MKSPTEAFADPRMEGVRRWLLRYQPFITTIVAVALIAIFLPGRTQQSQTEEASELSSTVPEAAVDTAVGKDVAAGGGVSVAGASTTRSTAQGATGVLTFEEARKQGVALVANCDPATGRVMVPSRFAAPCVQKFVAPNGGSTWKGVTDKKITVVVYRGPENPAAQAILAAAGANDSNEEVEQQHREWVQYYSTHYNLWGRKIDLKIVRSSAREASDDAAGKADAIKVAEEYKAFASLGALNNTYAREVMARGTMCFECQISQPAENYLKVAPYSWAVLSASTFLYVHRAEYVGKRLARRNAIYAYDDISPTQGFKTKPRKFGLLYYETKDYAYKAGADFFVKELAKYGVKLTVKVQYTGYPDLAANQEQARPLIQKMKEAGVTSMICACDPFAPIFFTQEATRQLYGPEWIIVGSALTDTSFFARTYDQDQWSHAFGLSALFARMPEKYGDSYRLLLWQFNKEPTARAGYAVIRAAHSLFFTGVHMAGPTLTPKTFQAGMFALPVTGRGSITSGAISFGNHGFWPMADYTAFDDMTEIWWDREAEGEDEIGLDGTGLYRYVDGGKRFMPTEYPSTNVKPFVKAGTVLIYDKPPKQDQWPCYTSPATHRKDRC